MKDKIKAAFKRLFPAVNISNTRLDAIADKLAAKITDETEIDAKLNDLNDITPFAELAKQDDKVRDLEAKVKAGQQQPPKTEEPPKTEPETPTDAPAWAKTLMDGYKTVSESLAKLQQEKQAGSIQATVAAKLKEVPASYWQKRAMPAKVEDVDAFVTEVTTDYQAFTKDLVEQGYSQVPTPGGSNSGGAGTPKPASKEEVDAVIANIGI